MKAEMSVTLCQCYYMTISHSLTVEHDTASITYPDFKSPTLQPVSPNRVSVLACVTSYCVKCLSLKAHLWCLCICAKMKGRTYLYTFSQHITFWRSNMTHIISSVFVLLPNGVWITFLYKMKEMWTYCYLSSHSVFCYTELWSLAVLNFRFYTNATGCVHRLLYPSHVDKPLYRIDWNTVEYIQYILSRSRTAANYLYSCGQVI